MELLQRGREIYGGEVVSTGRRETCMYQTVKREHEDGGLCCQRDGIAIILSVCIYRLCHNRKVVSIHV